MTRQRNEYQEAILKRHEDDTRGNIIIQALAGTGKTTTLIDVGNALKARGRAAYCAFGKANAEDIRKRVDETIEVSTIHSLCQRGLRRELKPKGAKWVDSRKYWKYTEDIPLPKFRDKKSEYAYRECITDLIAMTQLTLTDPKDTDAMDSLVEHYGVDLLDDSNVIYTHVAGLMRKGELNARQTIDFNDMLWLTHKLNAPLDTFDYMLVDESQDLNSAQRENVLRMVHSQGKLTFVGDRNQSIYGFACADTRSMDRIQERTKAEEMPLNICYRCPTSHIELANSIVPDLQAAPNAKAGVIDQVDVFDLNTKVKPGDMVLCRTTAPLVQLGMHLMGCGVPVKVKGKDIHKGLSLMLDDVEKYVKGTFDDFTRRCEVYTSNKALELNAKHKSLAVVDRLYDKAQCVLAIHGAAAFAGCGDMDQFRRYMMEIFEDPTGNQVVMSTAHRAKGLEAERVFLYRMELVPHYLSRLPWQLDQESNLHYIMLTRSKEYLGYINGAIE